jgi:hypothetical protein
MAQKVCTNCDIFSAHRKLRFAFEVSCMFNAQNSPKWDFFFKHCDDNLLIKFLQGAQKMKITVRHSLLITLLNTRIFFNQHLGLHECQIRKFWADLAFKHPMQRRKIQVKKKIPYFPKNMCKVSHSLLWVSKGNNLYERFHFCRKLLQIIRQK